MTFTRLKDGVVFALVAILFTSAILAAQVLIDASVAYAAESSLQPGNVSALTTNNSSAQKESKSSTKTATKTKAPTRAMSITLSEDQRKIHIEAWGTKLKKASSVVFPVWTEAGGQDDLIWHKAKRKGSKWIADIAVKRHASAGTCHVHAYYTVGGKQKTLAIRKIQLPKQTAKASVAQVGNGCYRVVVDDIECPSGIASVQVPSWTKKNNKKDIKWYTAKKRSDGAWEVLVQAKNHKARTGVYVSKVYVTGKNGIRSKVGSISQKVTAKDYAYITGKKGTGSRTLWIKNPSTSSMKAKVWSTASNGTDAKTYKAKKYSSSLWRIDINCMKLKQAGAAQVEFYTNGKLASRLSFKADKTDLSRSGDPELDRILKKIIDKKIGRGENALSRAFYYVAGYRYIGGSTHPTGNWSVGFAKEMYRNGGGNCYRFAALFCWLARELGYSASVVSGYVPSYSMGWAPHGWVEIRKNGKTYVCDPDMQHEIPGHKWFMVTYGQAPINYRK